MAKKPTAEQLAKQQEAYQTAVAAEITTAIAVAKKLFGDDVLPDTVFDTHSRMAGDSDEDLVTAYGMAKEIFAVEKPNADMVLGTFDAVFGDDEEDEEEDGEEE